MDDEFQAWFERTWSEREEAIWERYGPSHPPGNPEGNVLAFPPRLRLKRPGACAYVFRPCGSDSPMRVARREWTYSTHGLTQPAEEGESPGLWEFAVKTDRAESWVPFSLMLLMEEVADGADFGWGHRVAFFLAERDGVVDPFLGTPEQFGVVPIGAVRWLLLWPDLRPWGRIPCDTGTTGVLVATGLTQDEFDRLGDVDRCGHHLQLLLCERGVHQVTEPNRASVLADPAGIQAWKRIRALTPEQAYQELVTRFAMTPGDDSWPFEDAPNVAAYTVRPVMSGDTDVVLVTHDEDDGAWQFLDEGGGRQEDAMLVSLGEMLRCDPSLREVARLPLGWEAVRTSADARWHWQRRSAASGEEEPDATADPDPS